MTTRLDARDKVAQTHRSRIQRAFTRVHFHSETSDYICNGNGINSLDTFVTQWLDYTRNICIVSWFIYYIFMSMFLSIIYFTLGLDMWYYEITVASTAASFQYRLTCGSVGSAWIQ